MNLIEQLSAIGIPPASNPIELHDEDTVELVTTAVHAFLHRRDLAPYDLLELHATLSALVCRVEVGLTSSGSKITKEALHPTIKKRGVVRRWTAASGKTEAQDVEFDAKCDHRLVDVDGQQDFLICRACKAYISPIWWLARHHKDVSQAERWRVALEEERRSISLEIESLKAERAKHKQAVRRAKK